MPQKQKQRANAVTRFIVYLATLMLTEALITQSSLLAISLNTYPCEIGQLGQQITWPAICTMNQLSIYATSETHLNSEKQKLEENHSTTFYQLEPYIGIHLWPNISVHFQGLFSHNTLKVSERRTEYSFAQLGNPSTSRFQASIGKIDLPFGLNWNPFAPLYRDRQTKYWRRSLLGLKLSTRNNNHTRYELGFSEDSFRNKIISFRASIDLAALEGTKLALSGLRDHSYNLFSFGLLNTQQGATTAFELVRRTNKRGNHDQLYRLSHKSKKTRYSQWSIGFELDERNYWNISIQPRLLIASYASLFATIAHERSLIRTIKSRWLLQTNLEIWI